jgi:predicted 2-oxoglutarate/Fe(II)-dependent dioxygenase YbiX
MKPIKLSENFTIYTDRYSGEYPVEEFLKYVELNDRMSIHTNDNSVWMEIETECFSSVNSYIKNKIESITNKKFVNYAQHFWVYTQTKGFNMEWMHQHLQVHPHGRSNILSDFTFTFYLQTTDEISGDEGCIVFEDEDKKRHKFLPQVGDIFIFPCDIRHTAIPTPNSEKKRIVYAGSFCIDIENQKLIKKQLL